MGDQPQYSPGGDYDDYDSDYDDDDDYDSDYKSL